MTKEATHHKTAAVTCPHCNHVFTDDDCHRCDTDIWALAPDEETAELQCPSCQQQFWVQGGFRPQYTTAISKDDLA